MDPGWEWAVAVAAVLVLAGGWTCLRGFLAWRDAEIDATTPEPRDAHVRRRGDKVPAMLERGDHVIPRTCWLDDFELDWTGLRPDNKAPSVR